MQQLLEWSNYYCQCHDAIDFEWIPALDFPHPKQIDGINCGPLSCLFIEQFVRHKLELDYNTSVENMRIYRKQMAKEIQLFFQKI